MTQCTFVFQLSEFGNRKAEEQFVEAVTANYIPKVEDPVWKTLIRQQRLKN